MDTKINEIKKAKMQANGGTRTHNLWIRSPMRYPIAPRKHLLQCLPISISVLEHISIFLRSSQTSLNPSQITSNYLKINYSVFSNKQVIAHTIIVYSFPHFINLVQSEAFFPVFFPSTSFFSDSAVDTPA